MKLIVITSEQIIHNEVTAINKLFEQGLETLHLRKPHASLDEIKKILDDIDVAYHSRIVLHDYFILTEAYDLKGIHLNKRNQETYPRHGLTLSRSCHSLKEIANKSGYDYLFLSPVFDSISKTGYLKGFTTGQLKAAKANDIINEQIIALGGITSEKIPEIRQYGFGGIAILGSLWIAFEKDNNIEMLLDRFEELKIKCKE